MKRIATFFLFILVSLLWSISAPSWGNPTRFIASAHPNSYIPATSSELHLLQNVKQIVAGSYHTCAVSGESAASASVKCWGVNSYGQLGDNTTLVRNLPVEVIALSGGITAVVAGANHTCTLSTAGAVQCWGLNESGQLGEGTTQNRHIPADVQGLSSGVLAIAAGDHHTCALLATAVKCWGANDYGQLGDTTLTQHNTPIEVSGLLTGVLQIAAGGNHTCVVTKTNGAKCWGNNAYGQLGDGSATLSRTTPVDVQGLSSGVTMVSLGESHTCAVVSGGIRCWGLNSDGQLGDGSETSTNTPVNVFNLNSGVSAITTGEKHSCALLSNGSVKCWGRNNNGEVGNTPSSHYLTMPVNVVDLNSGIVEVTAGARHTCARTNIGSVKCWGLNEVGQLGDGVNYFYTLPVSVSGVSDAVNDLAVGHKHSCALLNSEAKCWGDNGYRQLGNGVSDPSPIPVDVAISGITLTTLAAGDDHTCALTSRGGLKCWGGNYWGQLGGGDTGYTGQIVDVNGLTSGVIAVSARRDHTCALVAGNASCWGHNNYGQLGNGNTTDHSSPVIVGGLQDGELSAIASGGFHTCALTQNGGVKCWGFNQQGELGMGLATVSETTPVSVTGLVSGVVELSAGMYHSCALLANGGVKCWGVNDYGQLGDNSTQDRHTPVDVVGLASGVKAISAGYNYTCALLSSGEIKCWGENGAGQLGDGTFLNRKVPVTTIGLGGASSKVATGIVHTCALLSLGGIRCWGYGANGQLGNGQVAWRHTPSDVLIPGDSVTPTDTRTPTPTVTIATPTVSTPTPTVSTPGIGDSFENDDTCATARAMPSDGNIQTHTFHKAGDVDWVRFDAIATKPYHVEVTIPDGSSADVDLAVYNSCDSVPAEQWIAAFTPGVRLEFTATVTGPIYLRLANYDATISGTDMRYQLSVRQLTSESSSHALIIVAGRLKGTDKLQNNIHNVTQRVYTLFQSNDYTDDTIYYLATDSRLAGYDAPATKDDLKAAITQWAKGKLQANGVLTLYLIDHGSPEIFYLDEVSGQRLTPTDLNDWLTQLESTVSGLKVNLIIEACESGSFIDLPHSVSKAGRIVLTSTNAQNDAKASREGAYFSDHLLTGLHQGYNLSASFLEASIVAKRIFSLQTAWLDANGNGIPNEFEDAALAAQRSFAYEGTFANIDNIWPPYIFSATGPVNIQNASGQITVDARDNLKVSSVWAVVYPPDYTPPETQQQLQEEVLPTILLSPTSNEDIYSGIYPGFTQNGLYRIVIHAEDNDGLVARPVEITVNTGSRVFLPLVTR